MLVYVYMCIVNESCILSKAPQILFVSQFMCSGTLKHLSFVLLNVPIFIVSYDQEWAYLSLECFKGIILKISNRSFVSNVS